MNLVVQRARHPELRDYIHSAVSGLLPFTQKNICAEGGTYWWHPTIFGMKSAHLYDDIPLERYVFKIMVNQSCSSQVEESELELSLRSFLIKLLVSKSLSKVLPQGCRWEITAYF